MEEADKKEEDNKKSFEFEMNSFKEKNDDLPMDAEQVMESFQHRFRVHKQDAKNKIVKRNQSSSLNRMNDFRVDHKNTPHRWKDQTTLRQEKMDQLQHLKYAIKEPVRPFPGVLKTAIKKKTPRVRIVREQDIKSNGLDKSDDSELLSSNAVDRLNTTQFLVLDISKFPLELYDDTSLETHTATEWLAMSCLATAQYYVKGEWRWRPCTVTSYDEGSEKYTVVFNGMQHSKCIKRINLRFQEVSTTIILYSLFI